MISIFYMYTSNRYMTLFKQSLNDTTGRDILPWGHSLFMLRGGDWWMGKVDASYLGYTGYQWKEWCGRSSRRSREKKFELNFPTFQKLDLIFFYRRASGSNFFFLVNLLAKFFFIGEPSVSIFFSRRPSESIFFCDFHHAPPRWAMVDPLVLEVLGKKGDLILLSWSGVWNSQSSCLQHWQ